MNEVRNANGLTLREGLEGWEIHQRAEGAICNAELLKWAREEIEDLRRSRAVEIEAKLCAQREIAILEADLAELRDRLSQPTDTGDLHRHPSSTASTADPDRDGRERT